MSLLLSKSEAQRLSWYIKDKGASRGVNLGQNVHYVLVKVITH